MAVGSAWEDERTVGSWRRERRVARVWLGVGTVCLGLFVLIVTRQADHADWLVAHGAETSGVVMEDPPQALRCSQVAVPVRFAGEVHPFYVDGCGGGGLTKGDVVTVNHDPANRAVFTVDQVPNDRPLPTFAAIIGLVAGWFLVVGFCVRARRLHRLRRILGREEWQTVTARTAPYPSSWSRGRWVVQLSPTSPVIVTQANGVRDLLRHDGPVECAGPADGPAALRDLEIDRLVLARQPRTRRSRERAVGILGAHAD